MKINLFLGAAVIALLAASTAVSPARADEAAAAPAADAPAADAPPAAWADTLKFSAQFELGYSHNLASGHSSGDIDFGHLFDDTADRFMFDQMLLTATRPLDTTATDYDVGFKLQAMYGSDARYTRFTHEFVSATDNNKEQFDIVEANLLLHTPWLSDGGVDLKLGQYSTPLGAETIDPSTNYFYSHSYIFNYGIPLKHSGILATWHVDPLVDLYASIDTGVNTQFENGLAHANNGGPPAFIVGVGLNLMDGNLTILGLSHVGTEIPKAAIANGLLPSTVSVNTAYRELNDIVTTWKVDDKLTLINELNWIHDDVLDNGGPADGYGVAFYSLYALDDTLSLNGRAEIFDDTKNVFVSQSGNNVDFLRGEEGLPALSAATVTGGPIGKSTTYGELTIGVTYKPAIDGVPALSSLLIRPELREDFVLNGSTPFNGGKDKSATIIAVDALIAF
jgi:hypothetical protein